MQAFTRNLISWKRHVLDVSRETRDVVWRQIFRQELRYMEREVRKACNHDRRLYFDGVAKDLETAGQA